MTKLDGRRVLITGSSRGAGLHAARLLLEQGATVVLNSRVPEDLEQLCTQLAAPGRVRALAFDVTDDEGTEAAIEWCSTTWGAIDTVVHAVPAGSAMHPAELSQDAFEQALRLLLSGTLNAARAARSVGVPRVVVLAPSERGFARQAVLDLITSLAGTWEGTRVIGATTDEFTRALGKGQICA